MDQLTLAAVKGLPYIQPGDNLPVVLAGALTGRLKPQNGDILVVAQKVVSKAEGAIVDLKNVIPTELAQSIAVQTGRDPRHVQVILSEASEVLRIDGRMIITRHRLGFVGSSSGVDRSNVADHSLEIVVLLPQDPDASARAISDCIFQTTGKRVAVIINDSGGRDHRGGSVGMAIGVGGIQPIKAESRPDLFGNAGTSQIAIVDEVAAAASILMGQANEGVPAVLVRGVEYAYDMSASILTLLH